MICGYVRDVMMYLCVRSYMFVYAKREHAATLHRFFLFQIGATISIQGLSFPPASPPNLFHVFLFLCGFLSVFATNRKKMKTSLRDARGGGGPEL